MYRLPSELTIHEVSEIKKGLLDLADNNPGEKEYVINGADVKDVDAAGIQVLLSFYKTLQNRGAKVSLKESSDTLIRMLKLSGTLEYLCEEVKENGE